MLFWGLINPGDNPMKKFHYPNCPSSPVLGSTIGEGGTKHNDIHHNDVQHNDVRHNDTA
jgi:hypothetical protein